MQADVAPQRLTDESAGLWPAVDRLLEGAEIQGIRAHKLGALAARLWRRRGRHVPSALAGDERGAATAVVMARPLLEQIRRVCDGPLVLIKGPEVARLYPGAARTFGDVDLLAGDAQRAQRALIEAGFVEEDDPELFFDHHHLRPLKGPMVGLKVELHTAPLWPVGATPPSLEQILASADASRVGVEGVSAPDPVHHALILAAHAWCHDPLRTLRDLVDVAAVIAGCSETELTQTAEAWGISRIWRTTRAAIRALLEDGPATLPLHIWARHLAKVRKETLLDNHLMRWLHGFWEMPPREALADLRTPLRLTFLPMPGESWPEKLARAGRGIMHPGEPMSSHLNPSEEVRKRRAGS